ncbi:MAG: hypothetical protein Q8R81_04085 [Novosphingobium sp.]|uniref:hypothetical protein n=1 Tax=Novosphingobium sp. TaxID=1874826 RepID=UPI002732B658|nr:hypothetical protein [Novosphingobium sp.]MDP3549559.1 hypothetical protein [Novosphingobium sp.]
MNYSAIAWRLAGILVLAPLGSCTQKPATTGDLPSVAQAKEECSGLSTRVASKPNAPPVGKNSDFTKCMLEQANKVIGSREFEQICSAIPGARSDSEDGKCFIVHF